TRTTPADEAAPILNWVAALGDALHLRNPPLSHPRRVFASLLSSEAHPPYAVNCAVTGDYIGLKSRRTLRLFNLPRVPTIIAHTHDSNATNRQSIVQRALKGNAHSGGSVKRFQFLD